MKDIISLDGAKEIITKLEEEVRTERFVRSNYEQKISQLDERIRDLSNIIHERDLQIYALQNAINYIARKVDLR